jgi:hypothetical protein
MARDYQWELPSPLPRVSGCVQVDEIGATGCGAALKIGSDVVKLAGPGCGPIERQAGELHVK